MSSKKIWLTGSRGFIGRVLALKLKKAGAELSCFTNQIPEEGKNLPKGSSCIHMDYLDAEDIEEKVNRLGLPDIFIHLGWGDMTKPESSLQMGGNVQASKNLITTLFKVGLEKFIFIGSMNEYGARTGLLSEDMGPEGRLTNYAKGKIEVAKFGFQNAKIYGKKFIHVRMFYVFGAGQREGSLINELYQSYRKGMDISLSPCEHYRDYIHVSDIAEGLRLICDIEESTTINLGSGSVIKVKDFVLFFWKMLGGDISKLKFGARDLRVDEPEQPKSYADLTRLKRLTHWTPALSLEDGIKKTIQELRESSSSIIS